ncbi:MAG: DUF484 family protein [Salinisphaera sp.]|jgi:uncharacterized protein YigA (DUF484 family)|nr:DUF484 family protein [Salinisphaera sp.]
MNEAEKQPEVVDLDEADVAAYLTANPDFLRRHPETFESLDVAHKAGAAVSLIERQVRVLRETNHKLQARFDELMTTARENEQRVVQLNRVARVMVGAISADDLVNGLARCLQQHLDVDRVYIGLQGELPDDVQTIDCLIEGEPASRALTNVFRRGKPICGALSAEQVSAWFPADDKVAMTSAALVPLGSRGVQGAIVLASADPERFAEDMGTLFIELFGQLLTASLQRVLGDQLLPR